MNIDDFEKLTSLGRRFRSPDPIEPNLNVDLEKERRRADEFDNDYKSLKIKYDDVCERIRIATHQLEHVQIVLEETSRRCEQLEKEKSEINAQSGYLSQNVLNVTSKYKDKLNIIKVRLEQAERERREVQLRNEKFQNDRQPFDVKNDGIRESVIVTKIFDVKIIPSDHSLSDEYENRYLYELQQERKTRILCPHCKSTNSIHLRTCYICENVLIPTSTSPEKRTSISIPTISKQTNTIMITCSKCFRLNNPNARFCDWCGAYPEHISTSIQCTKCHTNNDSFGKFCSTCGCVIEPPLRISDTRLKNDLNISSSSMIASTLTRNSVNPVWLNANTTLTNYHQSYSTIKKEAATQTYGIYYPSAKDIDLIITQNKKLLNEKELKEYRPILTSTSPGKGYWRQQLDHICAHLKTYAVNRPDFQSLIGEPRMGNMIHATVHENEYQVTIQTVFRKPENLSQSPFFINETNEYYPINSERSSPYSNTIYSDNEYPREKSERTKVKHRNKKRPQSANTITKNIESSTHALIRLFEKKIIIIIKKSSHQIDILKEVQRIIKEKADVNIKNKEGYTVLQLGIRNGYYECLETLIIDGKAKLDKKGP
ncbi:unnamed protein product, partial [Rotaria sp. Silwood1]